jgi:4-diphosphocytidyl-2-C-methyl-D-erythritol kinase
MKILSPAKINLYLQVTGKRPDGYHDLISLMCCVDLYDEVSLSFGRETTTVTCDHPEVPEDPSNLAHAAAALFLKSLNKKEGANILIEKKIPVAAGLGGGSSNAAAVLLGFNRYYGYPYSREDLARIGVSIGADVPFFLYGRPAVARGIGDQIDPYTGLEKFSILLVYPGLSVSTAEVYKNLNLALTNCKKKLSYSLLQKNGFDPRKHLCNDLETVVALKYPEILKTKETLLQHGAIGALMSGSGSTVFGLFADPEEAQIAGQALLNDYELLYSVEMITQDTGNKILDAG